MGRTLSVAPRQALAAALAALSLHGGAALAGDLRNSPEAPGRTYAQNYKDMVLAACIARAYKNDAAAGKDASYSASAYVEWTPHDLEKTSDVIDALIERYLARDYRNPLVEYQGVDFNLLKCLDMYHSKELDDQVRKFVPKPRRTFRQDYPPSRPGNSR